MTVGMLSIALRIPGAQTLKDKRRVLRSLLEIGRRRFGVSAAEVADHDLAGNATIGACFVSSSAAHVEHTLQALCSWIESHPEVEVYDVWREIESRGLG
jgi:uncharacterized protein YlxP (DUF503 family)